MSSSAWALLIFASVAILILTTFFEFLTMGDVSTRALGFNEYARCVFELLRRSPLIGDGAYGMS